MGKIWNAVLAVLVTMAALLAIAFFGVRLVGLAPYAVLTGSMEPELPVGSLAYVRHVDPYEVKIGDAITFKLESGTLVTHEVYQVDEAAREFRTRGIANVDSGGNISPDASPVPFSQLVGVVVFCIPNLGYINSYITQPPGMYVVIAFVAMVVAVSIAIELFETRGEERDAGRPAPKHMR